MKNKTYKHIKKSLFCVLITSTTFMNTALKAMDDEPPGSIELYINGRATSKRIEGLEAEKLLDVKSTVRIRDNFVRIDKQVRTLKEERGNLIASFHQFNSEIPTLRNCVYDTIKEKISKEANGNKYTSQSWSEIDIEAMGRCFTPCKSILEKMPAQKHALPEDEASGNTGEKIWWYERNFGLSTTHKKIKALEKEGNLDVRSDVRTRDNLNRVRNQVVSLKKEINKDIEHINVPRELFNCLEGTQSFIHGAPDIQIVQDKFYRCFDQYNHDQYKGNLSPSFNIK